MKLFLIRETVHVWMAPGKSTFAYRYDVALKMPTELREGVRSATVIAEANTLEELYTYFN